MRLKMITLGAAAVGVLGLAAAAIGYSQLATTEPIADERPVAQDTLAAEQDNSAVTFNMRDEPQPVPQLKFVDAGGRAMTLEAFRGKTVLLNVWATWCPPCRHEMPTLDRLQAERGGADFIVVPLSIDGGGVEVVEKFYREIGLENLGIFVDSSMDAMRDLGVVGLPTTLLLDRDGRELGRLVGPAEWDAPEMIAFLDQFIEEAAAGPPPRGSDKTSFQAPEGPIERDFL